MLLGNDLRNGTIFEYQGEPFRVLNYRHTHLGRGSANIRVKIKGLVSGKIASVSFSSDRKFEEVNLLKKQMKYLYTDRENLHLVDLQTNEELEVKKELVGQQINYISKGEVVEALYWDNKFISFQLPTKKAFRVTQAEPAQKGNSATNVFKKVKIETGFPLKVPLFIDQDEKIIVNTETGQYISRA
ncbi:elongation factor P [Patescibacteria group bacterium]